MDRSRWILMGLVLVLFSVVAVGAQGAQGQANTQGLAGAPLTIYQGILPTASGPGMEVTLYLYTDGEAAWRYSYLKFPEQSYFEFGQQRRTGEKLDLIARNDGPSFYLLQRGRYLYLRDPQNDQMLYQGVPRACLVQISSP